MKKLLIVIMAFAAVAASAIEIREATFSPEEIPATNPRIERRGDVVTHIEVFDAFETQLDGSVKTRVAVHAAPPASVKFAVTVMERAVFWMDVAAFVKSYVHGFPSITHTNFGLR